MTDTEAWATGVARAVEARRLAVHELEEMRATLITKKPPDLARIANCDHVLTRYHELEELEEDPTP
jgi:hypothetical protein